MLEARSISKSYSGIRAVDKASLTLTHGRCRGLVGENGAGKSTLGKVLAGLLQPDSGCLFVSDEPVTFLSPGHAASIGITIVHQELLLCENLSVAENLSLPAPPAKGWFLDRRAAREQAVQWLAAVASDVDVDSPVAKLAPAKQQLVQIAGALGRGARIVIFDEPTSSLPQPDVQRLLKTIRKLKTDGLCCLYISHRLDEILEVCDDITVMRDGMVVADAPTEKFDKPSLVSAMVGRDVKPTTRSAKVPIDHTIEVESLSSLGKLKGINLAVSRGEIVGLAGLVGAGRTELLDALFGLDPHANGTMRLGGVDGIPQSPAQAMSRGVGLVPEDRKRFGLVLSMTPKSNATLATLDRVSRAGFLSTRRETSIASDLLVRLRVRTAQAQTTAYLSGGNQQKVVIAKWLATGCEILLVDEPTRGIDVGARAEIHQILVDLAANGKTILMASSDMAELLELSHRIVVLRDGCVAGELDGNAATEELVLRLMSGVANT